MRDFWEWTEFEDLQTMNEWTQPRDTVPRMREIQTAKGPGKTVM